MGILPVRRAGSRVSVRSASSPRRVLRDSRSGPAAGLDSARHRPRSTSGSTGPRELWTSAVLLHTPHRSGSSAGSVRGGRIHSSAESRAAWTCTAAPCGRSANSLDRRVRVSKLSRSTRRRRFTRRPRRSGPNVPSSACDPLRPPLPCLRARCAGGPWPDAQACRADHPLRRPRGPRRRRPPRPRPRRRPAAVGGELVGRELRRHPPPPVLRGTSAVSSTGGTGRSPGRGSHR